MHREKPDIPSPEYLRDLSIAERRAMFLAFAAVSREKLRLKQESEDWHELDGELTSDEIEEIPPGIPGDRNRSPLVWVHYLHRRLDRYFVAQGRYLYDKNSWIARTEPQDFADRIEPVQAIAWAPIQPGRKPEDVFIIPKNIRALPK